MYVQIQLPETITYKEGCQRYLCHPQAIRKAVRSGVVDSFRPGKEVLLAVDQADAWFFSTRIGAAAGDVPDALPELLTLTDAALEARCSRQELRRAIEAGEIDGYKPGKQVVLVKAQLVAWFMSKQVKIRKAGRPRGGRKRHN